MYVTSPCKAKFILFKRAWISDIDANLRSHFQPRMRFRWLQVSSKKRDVFLAAQTCEDLSYTKNFIVKLELHVISADLDRKLSKKPGIQWLIFQVTDNFDNFT
jgi:hypothetical protein